jgi:hypothetical protein
MDPKGRLARTVGIFALVLLLAAIDYLTGYELQFFFFYFVPVGLAAWYLGRAHGLAFAVLSAATWLSVDLWSGHPYTRPVFLYWNAAIRLGSFVAIAIALSQIRLMLEAEIHLRKEVQKTMSEVKQLRGFLPICAACKKIRNDAGLWEQIELYIRAHSEAEFTHGLCPDCAVKLYGHIGR